MSKYVIVSMLEPEFPQEFQSSDWPLHVTLLRPFETEVGAVKLIELLKKISDTHQELSTTGKSKEMFGEKEDVAVTELICTPELQKLHDDIKTAFIDDITFIAHQYPTFRPHMTEQNGKSINVGEVIALKNLSLIAINAQLRTVLSAIALAR
jgi:2'-5' RNA ligase